MTALDDIIDLTSRLIRHDTVSNRSNVGMADVLQGELGGFEVERLDFADDAGVRKCALVAFRGVDGQPFVAFSAHMDTVPPVGWTRDPLEPAVADGRLFGLGSCDMKGPLATAVAVASGLPVHQPVMLLLTCDEETTKAGARRIMSESVLLKERPPAGIVVVEPTELVPLRGHRADIQFVTTARGIQAHSSTPFGLNANISLIPFLSDMRALYVQLRADPKLQDAAYVPPWCDLNIIVDNHGAAPNITPDLATCVMKFRYSKAIDSGWLIDEVKASARRHNLELAVRPEGTPPELPLDHPFVRFSVEVSGQAAQLGGFGSDASQLSTVFPTIVFGPGSMQQAHRPEEYIALDQIERAVPMLRTMATVPQPWGERHEHR